MLGVDGADWRAELVGSEEVQAEVLAALGRNGLVAPRRGRCLITAPFWGRCFASRSPLTALGRSELLAPRRGHCLAIAPRRGHRLASALRKSATYRSCRCAQFVRVGQMLLRATSNYIAS